MGKSALIKFKQSWAWKKCSQVGKDEQRCKPCWVITVGFKLL